MPLTDKSPATWFGSGYTTSPGKIELSTEALLKELTESDANETNGDFRKVLSAIVEGLYLQYNDKYTKLPVDSRPTRMVFTRAIHADQSTGDLTRSYNIRFELQAGSISLANEPEPKMEVLPPANEAVKSLPSASPDAQVA